MDEQIKIFWTQTAKNQRNSIFKYWNNKNKSNTFSKRLNIEIRHKLQLLKTQPNIGKPSEILNYRVIFIRQFSLIYSFNKETIIILAFWDNRQDPSKLLKLFNND